MKPATVPVLVVTLLSGAGCKESAPTDAPPATLSPQLTASTAQAEQRDQVVTPQDLAILVKAEALLKDESVWNRQDDRECDDDEAAGKRSLFCALQRACIDVLGSYDHRRVALQEVRFAVEDATRGRQFEHRLRDFNNLQETGLADVKRVLHVAQERVSARLKPTLTLRFDRVVLLEQTSETSANVSIGDLNRDGNPDIVLAKGRHWPLVDRVLLGDGRGAFAKGYDLSSVSDRSYSGLLVDVDADGDLDVVISNDLPDPKRVYLNDGKGHFQTGSTYGNAKWPTRNASVADMNGDGLPDIIVANRTGRRGGPNYICLNRGKGEFDSDCTAFAHESSTTITPADINHDGLIDLIVPHRDSGQSHVYVREKAEGLRFKPTPFGPADASIRMSDAADLDSDGLLDIIVIDEERGVAAFFGQRDGSFSAAVAIGGTRPVPYALAVSDVDLDGKTDVVVGHVEAPSVVQLNDGTGRRFMPVSFGDDKGTVYGFAIGDLDKDGRPDIAVARSEAPNVVFFAVR